MQDFFEKSYSKIMKISSQSSKENKGLGKLFINAMQNIKKDSINKNQSNFSKIHHSPYIKDKKSNFVLGIILLILDKNAYLI